MSPSRPFTPLTRTPTLRHRLAVGAAFAACYVFLDWATYLYAIRPFAITTWDPCAGLALAFLLVFGTRQWPALALAALLADVLVRDIPSQFFLAPLAAGVITAGYVAMAALLRGPLGFRNEFDHLRDMTLLMVMSAFGTLMVAIAYVSVYRAGDLVAASAFQPAVVRFWLGDLVGIITTTPLLLLLANWPRVKQSLRQRPWPLIGAQAGAVVLTLWVIFGLRWADEYKLFYLLFLPLIWIVMNYAIVGAAFGITAIQLGLMATVRISGYKAAAVMEFEFLMLALAGTGRPPACSSPRGASPARR